MKTTETKNLNTENNQQENQQTVGLGFVEFGDVVVYNEMADQTSVRVNLISQIHSQLDQMEELNSRRSFLLKEVTSLIS